MHFLTLQVAQDRRATPHVRAHVFPATIQNIYARIHGQAKRQVLGKLPSGRGAVVPAGVLEYSKSGPNPVQYGHRLATSQPTGAGG